MLISDLQTVSF